MLHVYDIQGIVAISLNLSQSLLAKTILIKIVIIDNMAYVTWFKRY